MSPLSKKVERAGITGIKRKRKPYQVYAEDFFTDCETLRILFSKVIGNAQPNRIAILPSVSYGISTVAKNLNNRPGEILIVDEQFPSNVYAWKELQHEKVRLKVIARPDGIKTGKEWNSRILEGINRNTILVSIGNVHWADGTKFDLQAIREKTNEHNSLLVIDGTQSVGALPINVEKLQPDALICAGYKWLFGPYSIGLGYFGPRFDQGMPLEENWIGRLGSENFGGLINYEDQYQPGALRYDVGERSNFILVPMMVAALKQLLHWGVSDIEKYCKMLTQPLVSFLQEEGLEIEDTEYRSNHLLGLRLPGNLDVSRVQSRFKQNKVSVSLRGSSIRISPNVYNDSKDIERLMKSLKSAIE